MLYGVRHASSYLGTWRQIDVRTTTVLEYMQVRVPEHGIGTGQQSGYLLGVFANGMAAGGGQYPTVKRRANLPRIECTVITKVNGIAGFRKITSPIGNVLLQATQHAVRRRG